MALTVTYSRTNLKSDFQTNTWTPSDQLAPDVLGLSNGGFVATYNNVNGGGKNFPVLSFYDASFNAIGNFQGEHPYAGVDTTTAAGQPSLTQLANGNVFVVWDNNDPGDAGLRGHLYSPAGAPIGSELTLAFSGTLFDDPQVVALRSGGFVISFTQNFGTSSDAAYRVYDDAGNPARFDIVNSNRNGLHNDSAVAALADGGFVVTYTDFSPGHPSIRAAIYNAPGSVRQADFLIVANGDDTQSKVVGLPNGNFAVVYTDSGWFEGGTLGNGITLNIFSPTGTNITPGDVSPFIHVNTASTVDETDPDVTVLANGFIVVTWTHPFSGVDHDIYGRVFDQNGNAVTINGSSTEFIVDANTSDEILSAVSHLTGGKFITSWQDSASDGSGGRISSTISELTRTTVGDGANDTFVGDQLRDTFTGGGGDDTFVFKPGGNADVWTDFSAGAGTPDKIDLTGFHTTFGAALAHAAQSGSNTVFDFGGGDTLTLNNVAKTGLSHDDFAGLAAPIGDFNADGFGDILFRNNSTGDTGYTDLHNNVFHGLGGSPVAYSVVGSGDYNGDGFSDTLFRNNSTGDTGYTDVHNNVFHSLGGSPAAYSVVGSGDYNGDGFSDILFRNNSTGDTGYNDVHNNVFHSLGGSPVAYSVVGSGDYNGDGFSDILFRNNSTGDTGYTDVHNNVFHSLGGSPAAYSVVGSGDYNGDGFSDILFRNNSTGDTGYTDVHNNVFHSLGGSPAAYSVVGSGDYNGDGFSDILFRNNSTGDTGYNDVQNNVFHSLGGSPTDYLVVA
jgi:hypothetical protein